MTQIKPAITLSLNSYKVKQNSKITSINFKLADTLLIGLSDGSILKIKNNDDPISLLLENSHKNTGSSCEEEFEKIQSVFSTDNQESSLDRKTNDNSFSFEINSVDFLLVSLRFKTLFSIQKQSAGVNKVNLFCLRSNTFEKTFCKIEGTINTAKLIDKKDLLIITLFKFETKFTSLQVWHYNESSCPLSIYNLSQLLDYPFTVRTMSITQMPDRYYGRNTNHGVVDGDMIFLGSTRGDVVLGKILTLTSTNKIGFEPLYIYKLRNSQGEEMCNKYEISYITFDLYFDVLIIGDVSSNVKFFEKILQIGKQQSQDENLPFFSFFSDSTKFSNKDKLDETVYNYDLPLFSVNHDVIKDRSIITYDQGRDLTITTINEDSMEEESNKKNLGDLIG